MRGGIGRIGAFDVYDYVRKGILGVGGIGAGMGLLKSNTRITMLDWEYECVGDSIVS